MAQQPSTTKLKPAVRAPLFRIETAQRKERYLKLLIYGNFGVGKTYLAGTASEVESMTDVLLINAEAGDLSLEGFTGIDSIAVHNFRTLGRIQEYLKQHCKARDANDIDELKKLESAVRGIDVADIDKPKTYHTVILDSLTELEAYCMNQLLGVTDSTRLDDEGESAEWGEYKKNNSMMQRLVRAFRDLPMHVIFTASETYTQDENKRKGFSPDMTGKLSKKIQGFMDMVGYYVIGMKNDKRMRRLHVVPSPTAKFDAKHRYHAFKEDYFDDPTIQMILEATKLTAKGGTPLK